MSGGPEEAAAGGAADDRAGAAGAESAPEPGAGREPGAARDSGAARESGAGREPGAARDSGAARESGAGREPGAARKPGTAGLRRLLGSPFQIVLLLASFVLAGYAGVRFLADDWLGVAVWFVGAALLHDLVLVPLYSLADRVPRLAGRYVNHLRIPALLSLLLLLVWFPLITGPADRYAGLTGRPDGNIGYALHWLWLTVGLFAVSGLWLAVRTLRGRRGRKPAPQGRRSATNDRPPDSH
ncbi:hypothetical protein [Streptomyces qinglanensis]|uniref:hypothetical protein n=1 Tax=Streptomyces qinglanensis TaxID=943816 RepID=UPI003D73939D